MLHARLLCFTYKFSIFMATFGVDYTVYRWEKIRSRRLCVLPKFSELVRARDWSNSQASFLSRAQAGLSSGELNLLATQVSRIVRNKHKAILSKAINWNAKVPSLYTNRWFLAKTDFKVISVKQTLLVYHYGIQNTFPKKEFPCLLHHKYLVKGNCEQPPRQMLGVAAS